MVLRSNELRLGSPEAATGSWTRPLRLAGAADRRGDRRGPRDGSWLFAGRWDPGARPRAARRTGGKTSHFHRGVHRLYAGKSSHLWNGVHRRGEPGVPRMPALPPCLAHHCTHGRGPHVIGMWNLLGEFFDSMWQAPVTAWSSPRPDSGPASPRFLRSSPSGRSDSRDRHRTARAVCPFPVCRTH